MTALAHNGQSHSFKGFCQLANLATACHFNGGGQVAFDDPICGRNQFCQRMANRARKAEGQSDSQAKSEQSAGGQTDVGASLSSAMSLLSGTNILFGVRQELLQAPAEASKDGIHFGRQSQCCLVIAAGKEAIAQARELANVRLRHSYQRLGRGAVLRRMAVVPVSQFVRVDRLRHLFQRFSIAAWRSRITHQDEICWRPL